MQTILDTYGQIRIPADNDTSVPDLLFHELDRDFEQDIEFIRTLSKRSAGMEIFIISETSDPDMLIQVLKLGAKEFFKLPLDKDVVHKAMQGFLERYVGSLQSGINRQGRILSVLGSKGGVGTTTFAVNLAVSIAETRKEISVALLDMNMVFGEIPMFLDIAPKHHWGDITKNIDRLDGFLLDDILARHESGINILPSPGYFGNHPFPTPSVMETLLNLMIAGYDYIIIDIGQSINETALRIINLSRIVHIIAIQSLPCLSNTNRLIKSIIRNGFVEKNQIRVIMNRYISKGIVSKENAEEGIGQKLSWIIPNDYSTTMTAINSGKPMAWVAPRSKIVQSFRDYAGLLFPEEEKKKKKGWFF